MGGVRTLMAATVATCFGASAAPGNPDTIELTRLFADCAGRFLAEAEHEALFSGHAAQQAMDSRDDFLMLLGAVLPAARAAGLPEARALSWRVEARAAQRALLAAGEFNMRQDAATRARATAERYIATCNRLRLGA